MVAEVRAHAGNELLIIAVTGRSIAGGHGAPYELEKYLRFMTLLSGECTCTWLYVLGLKLSLEVVTCRILAMFLFSSNLTFWLLENTPVPF